MTVTDTAVREAGQRFHPRHRRGRPRRRAGTRRSSPAFRRSRTAICISATPSRSASISASREEFGGRCNLRFDDTNPTKEEQEYIDAIERDVRWLGFDWGEHLYHASDYFEQLYEWAEHLIRAGKAYVDDQTPGGDAARRAARLTEPGTNSPYRDRSVEENLDLFRRMRAGEFPERRARAARQDRHGARATSICAIRCSTASCTRRIRAPATHVVHLSELRFRARPVGRDRGRHAFDLHAGVRGSPAALRLVPRQPAGAVAAASVRVRAAQSHLHGAVEARAHRAGARRPCQRLGRSAHADARRPAPPRRAAGGDPRFRQAHRRRQGQQRRRRRHVRILDPRGI